MYRTDRKWLRSPVERVGTLAHSDLPPPAGASATCDASLVRALRDGDEEAYETVIARYHSAMLRLARRYVRSEEEAEEAVQDTWVAVIDGIGRFQGRSSLKTWIFRILVNRARTRARRECRTVAFSSFHDPVAGRGQGGPRERVDWTTLRARLWEASWHGSGWRAASPDDAVLAGELHRRLDAAIAKLPARQRAVLTMRDIEGLSAEAACETLGVSESNQRVLLHRARLQVRRSLGDYVDAAVGQ